MSSSPSVLPVLAQYSSVRVTVVPTAITRRPEALVFLIASSVSAGIWNHSECI